MKFDYFLAVRAWKFLFLIYCGAILFYLAAPLFAVIRCRSTPSPSSPSPWRGFRSAGTKTYSIPNPGGSRRRPVRHCNPSDRDRHRFGRVGRTGPDPHQFPGKGFGDRPYSVAHHGAPSHYWRRDVLLLRVAGHCRHVAGMIMAHTVLAAPFVVLIVTATLANFNVNLMRAGAILAPTRSPFSSRSCCP